MKTPIAVALAVSLTASPAAALSLASCAVGSTPVAFGTYDPTSGVPVASIGTVTVSCNLIVGVSLFVAYSITLSTGSGSYTQRTMHSGGMALGYNLYSSSSYGSVWGDGTGGSSPQSDAYLLGLGSTIKNYPIYGRIPASQIVGAGTYSDSIVVSVTY